MFILFLKLYCFDSTDRKAHRNGIKKPKRYLHESTLGVSLLLQYFYYSYNQHNSKNFIYQNVQFPDGSEILEKSEVR